MRPYVELYIADKLVEFVNPPEIFMTYTHEDLHNPTVVKNSYSKTVTVDGTPRNNQLFGTFFNMQREVSSGYDGIGANFNASKRVPFALYRNGERMEHGYCKLDNVKRNGNMVQYTITLYGGLGQFFYNLTTKNDGEKMKLSDLNFGGGDKEFDLPVDKDVINRAWRQVNKLETYDEVFDKINFAPCYNGIPKDFAADKVAIDANSFWNANDFALSDQFEVDRSTGLISKNGYTDVDGWIIGELEKEYDELQMLDMRSYLQRPVIRFKEIINACCHKRNNGGFKVDLDPDFFNEKNPYYEDAWMTLPLVPEVETNTSEGLSVVDDGTGKFTISGLTAGDKFKVDLDYYVTSNAQATPQPNGYGSALFTGAYTFKGDTPLISANMAIYSQLVAYNSSGQVIGGSNIFSLTRIHGKTPSNFTYAPEYSAPITTLSGGFRYEGNDVYRYRFYSDDFLGQYISGPKETHKLTIEGLTYVDGMYFKFITKTATIDNGTVKGNAGKLFSLEAYNAYPYDAALSESWNEMLCSLSSTGYRITKKTLLNSEHTPCDYFLSYLKMFNLHIWQEDNDTVYVRLRKNYFTGVEYDLDDLLDRGSDINITPLTFDNKWYNFNNEVIETSLSKDYKDEYGISYGIQKVDTNYNFDTSSKNLFENNVFKNTITKRGKSKYYTNINIYHGGYNDYIDYPPFMLDGVKTLIFNASGDTTENTYLFPKVSDGLNPWFKQTYYDFMPRPDFTDSKNQPVDGANVLLFYNGKQANVGANNDLILMSITDDIPQFEALNDGEPCWIWTYDTTVALRPDYFPVFSRYKTNENNWITHSWDFGTPKALYVPDYQIDDTSNLYTQYWRPYIRDRYDVNTRVVNCKVLLRERVVGEWLRRFYFWDGCWWIMNKIEDYNPTSNGTTKCEMVKINDPQNYR